MHSRNPSPSPSPNPNPSLSPHREIDKLDFDTHRKSTSAGVDDDSAFVGHGGLLRDDESLLSNIVEGVIESDRRKIRRTMAKNVSFAVAVLCCLCGGSIATFSLYGPLLQTHLRYTQLQVNAVSITSGIAQYLLVPVVGFFCDRYSPRPVALASAVLLCAGYLLAAITYRKGPPQEGGWPYGIMVVAFIGIGMGTCCSVLSSVTTCAKNFGKSKHKGLAVSLPLAAYGLSGMWLSQVGSQLLYEPGENGEKGDLDVYRFFLFLMGLLLATGLLGALTLQVVDEGDLINEAVSELERSGFLDERAFSRQSLLHDSGSGYGTLSRSSSIRSSAKITPDKASFPYSDAIKKSLVLNSETQRFFADPTMWLLTAGFFFVSGPGESFINNLGTIIGTLYPPSSHPIPASNSPATNISTVAIASTVARLLAGAFSDLLSPSPAPPNSPARRKTPTIPRIVFLLAFAALPFLGQVLLASGLVQRTPTLFPLVSAFFGIGYGGSFALVPVVISVVWGVRNFGTNWGIVFAVPAVGATAWSAVYSAVYQAGADAGAHVGAGQGRPEHPAAREVLCYGLACYQSTFTAMAVCSVLLFGCWGWAGRLWKRAGIPV